MRKILFIFLLTSLFIKGYSQNGEFKWGQLLDNKDIFDYNFLKIDSYDKSSYWLLLKDNKCYLEIFDKDNIKKTETEISLPEANLKNKEKLYCSGVLSLKDNFYLLIYYSNKKDNKGTLYLNQFTYAGKLVNSSKVREDPYKITYYSSLLLSPDSSRILVSTDYPKQKGIEKCIGWFYLYDPTLFLIASQFIELPLEQFFTGFERTTVFDNSSNVYFLKLLEGSGPINKKDSEWIIQKINLENGLSKEFLLKELSDKMIQDIGLCINENGDITISGFYKSKDQRGSNLYKGAFFGSLKNDFSNIKLIEFNDEEKLNRTSPDHLLKMVRYVTKKDGGVILLSEQLIIDHNNKRVGNILILDLDKEGNVKYCTSILKNQAMFLQLAFAGFASFTEIYDDTKRKLILIFNDSPANLKNEGIGYSNQAGPQKAVPVLAEIDSIGNVTKGLISGTKSPTVIFCPLLSEKIYKYELLVIGREDKRFRMGKLQLFSKPKETSEIPLYKNIHINNKALKIGIKHVGFCLGNGRYYSGVRTNVFDKNAKAFNGLNIVLVKSAVEKNNGLSIGLLVNRDAYVNGISFGTFCSAGSVVNGLSISPFIAGAKKNINGVVIGGFGAFCGGTTNGLALSFSSVGGNRLNGVAGGMIIILDRIDGIGISLIQSARNANGLFFSLGSISKVRTLKSDKLRGVALAFCFISIDTVQGINISAVNVSKLYKGISIGLVNKTDKLCGVQLGLLNYAANNPKWLRLLPLINIHLKNN